MLMIIHVYVLEEFLEGLHNLSQVKYGYKLYSTFTKENIQKVKFKSIVKTTKAYFTFNSLQNLHYTTSQHFTYNKFF